MQGRQGRKAPKAAPPFSSPPGLLGGFALSGSHLDAGGLDLREDLLRRISSGAAAEWSDEQFDGLAREVFRHQYERNSIYRRFCEARGKSPESISSWHDIPAVPTDAFKAAPLVCGDPSAAEVVFRTSGTTRGASTRGEHYMLDTTLYRAALAAGFERHLLPDGQPMRIVSLVAPFDDVPDSSLSFMASEVVRRFGTKRSGFHADGSGVRLDEALDALEEAASSGEPVVVLGTSLAFLHVLDRAAELGTRIRLPDGSRAMDTGGFKGRTRAVGREALYAGIVRILGIPTGRIVNEYGMTEMSSQFYDGVAGQAEAIETRRYVGPPWVRTIAANPESLEPVSDGNPGILRHFDLANLDSVMALQTADVGVVAGGRFELRGRAQGAETRGCSIAMDELIAAAEDR